MGQSRQSPLAIAGIAVCILGVSLSLAACKKEAGVQPAADKAQTEVFTWPASLIPFGDGYPKAGAKCRQLRENAATANYLDDSAILVGCPGGPDDIAAKEIIKSKQGRVVSEIDGATMLSVPIQGGE